MGTGRNEVHTGGATREGENCFKRAPRAFRAEAASRWAASAGSLALETLSRARQSTAAWYRRSSQLRVRHEGSERPAQCDLLLLRFMCEGLRVMGGVHQHTKMAFVTGPQCARGQAGRAKLRTPVGGRRHRELRHQHLLVGLAGDNERAEALAEPESAHAARGAALPAPNLRGRGSAAPPMRISDDEQPGWSVDGVLRKEYQVSKQRRSGKIAHRQQAKGEEQHVSSGVARKEQRKLGEEGATQGGWERERRSAGDRQPAARGSGWSEA